MNDRFVFILCVALVAEFNAAAAEKPATTAPPTPGANAVKPPLSDADRAWADLLKAMEPPARPAEWQQKAPSEGEVAKYRRSIAPVALKAAEMAKAFYTRFPEHGKATEAKVQEYRLLDAAAQLGETNQSSRADAALATLMENKSLDEETRFGLAVENIQRNAAKKKSEGMDAVLADYEKGTRELRKQFPKRAEPYQFMLQVAQLYGDNMKTDKAKALVQEILASEAPAEVKEVAPKLVRRFDYLGKPIDFKFTATDGRPVDLSKMRGKVVLMDFWASWCQPCLIAFPEVRATYEKLHKEGFEIVGVNFDEDKSDMMKVVASSKLVWPHHFGGQGMDGKIGEQFGIMGIPNMWIIDKKGFVREMKQGISRDPDEKTGLEKIIRDLLDEKV